LDKQIIVCKQIIVVRNSLFYVFVGWFCLFSLFVVVCVVSGIVCVVCLFVMVLRARL
jgi:hypothetical protein